MKVLLLNGSPKADQCIYTALNEVAKTLNEEGVETEIIHVCAKPVGGCIACYACKKLGKCVFNDIVNEVAEKFKDADGIVVGSPVYYASANGNLTSFLDRLFFSSGFDKTMKVGAAVVSARRGGCSATFDQINKYFTICGMPVAYPHAAEAALPPLTRLTNTLPFAACPLPAASTGTACTATPPKKFCRTPKGCKPCAL